MSLHNCPTINKLEIVCPQMIQSINCSKYYIEARNQNAIFILFFILSIKQNITEFILD